MIHYSVSPLQSKSLSHHGFVFGKQTLHRIYRIHNGHGCLFLLWKWLISGLNSQNFSASTASQSKHRTIDYRMGTNKQMKREKRARFNGIFTAHIELKSVIFTLKGKCLIFVIHLCTHYLIIFMSQWSKCFAFVGRTHQSFGLPFRALAHRIFAVCVRLRKDDRRSLARQVFPQ